MTEVHYFHAKFDMIKFLTGILTDDSEFYGLTSMWITGLCIEDLGKYMRRNSNKCWEILVSIRGNINLPWIQSRDIGKSHLIPSANDAKGHRCVRRCPLLKTSSANYPRHLL